MPPSADGLHFFAPDVVRDPFPSYAALLRERPVCPVEPGGFLGVSRYEDVVRVLKTPEIFSSSGFAALFEPPWLGHNPGAHNMLVMDPPEQTKNRALVQRAFSPGTIAQIEPRIRAYVEGVADRLGGGDAIEIVEAFCSPVSAGVIGVFLDVDPDLHATFRRWTNTLASITPQPLSDEHAAAVRQAVAEMEAFMHRLIDERSSKPGADLVSQLIQARIDGQALSRAELVGFIFLLLAAGLESTGHLLSKSILTLTERPELADELRADPSLLPGFMSEQLRFDPPIHNLFRFAVADTEIAGVPIPAGSAVLAMLAAANRDPRQFPDPDRFDIRRNAQALVSFGAGPHYCLGAALARLEFQTAFAALLARFRRFERLDEEIAWSPSIAARGPAALRIRALPA